MVKPLGETRPAWKVLRVLANLLGLGGFGFETSDEVRAEALGDVAAIPGRLAAPASAAEGSIALPAKRAGNGLERIADVPIYANDPIVRRAPALQMTVDARPPVAGIPSELAAERGIVDGTRVRVSSVSGAVVLHARIDPSLASNVVRVAAAHPLTLPLGAMTVALGASAYSVGVFHLMTHAFFKALLFLAAGSVIIGMMLGLCPGVVSGNTVSAGAFHLMTHAFFKALLFLGAGSVIIALHHEQDLRRMGGLRKYM